MNIFDNLLIQVVRLYFGGGSTTRIRDPRSGVLLLYLIDQDKTNSDKHFSKTSFLSNKVKEKIVDMYLIKYD